MREIAWSRNVSSQYGSKNLSGDVRMFQTGYVEPIYAAPGHGLGIMDVSLNKSVISGLFGIKIMCLDT